MTLLPLLFINVAFAQDSFGLLVKTDYEAKVYFDRHIYQLRDDGEYPDVKKGDDVYSVFVATQTVHPSPLSIFKDKEEIFSTTLPPISNTEHYVLSVLTTESSLERFEIPSDNTDYVRLNRLFLLGIISLLIGIFLGFRIKKKDPFLEMKEQLQPTSQVPSQVISYQNKENISKQLLTISEDNFVVFIGGNPSEWNEPMGFGRWLFIEEGTLFDIKRYMQQMKFGDSVVFVYTTPENIVEFDCRNPDTQQTNINVLFQEYPKNVLVLLGDSSAM